MADERPIESACTLCGHSVLPIPFTKSWKHLEPWIVDHIALPRIVYTNTTNNTREVSR